VGASPFLKFWNDLNRATASTNDANTFVLEVVAATRVLALLTSSILRLRKRCCNTNLSSQIAECMVGMTRSENPSTFGQETSLSVPRALTTTSASSIDISLVFKSSTVTFLAIVLASEGRTTLIDSPLGSFLVPFASNDFM
jgi:hypothetical protein